MRNELRRVKPDGTEVLYPLPDDLAEAMAEARELAEWKFTKSQVHVRRFRDTENGERLDWEVLLVDVG